MAVKLQIIHEGQPQFISAASGLVHYQEQLFVIADDLASLATFSLPEITPGTMMPILPGTNQTTHLAKQQKPDFEAITLLPISDLNADPALFVLGSGSLAPRFTGVLLVLNQETGGVQSVTQTDLTDWYGKFSDHFPMLNIEGAVVTADKFILLQRGNQQHPSSAAISFELTEVQAWLFAGATTPKKFEIREYQLPQISGSPYCFTDGVALPEGGWLFSAAAEATQDNYADGACLGAAIGQIDSSGELVKFISLQSAAKIEGIAIKAANPKVASLFLVNDPDDPEIAAELVTLEFELIAASNSSKQG